MATSTKSAFKQFMDQVVNLDSSLSSTAKSSRNWLYSQVSSFPFLSSDFPFLYEERNIAYGSFARKTKVKPLDDIDLISCMSAEGACYFYNDFGSYTVVSNNNTRLSLLCHDGSDQVNSIRVVNRYVKELKNVPQYAKSKINRRHEVAVLNLTSYEWSFDIVPAFFTTEDIDGRNYYLMPDGKGHWKKTDPRRDRDRLSTTNQLHNGNVLNVVRLVKYWNAYRFQSMVPSYLIETIVVNLYDKNYHQVSSNVHVEFERVLFDLQASIYCNVQDPKGIDGNINDLSFDEKSKVASQASIDHDKCLSAISYENEEDHEESINTWIAILGSSFPIYG